MPTTRKPKSLRAQAACSRLDPQAKFLPAISICAPLSARVIQRSDGSGSPDAVRRQSKNRNSPYPVRSIRLRNCLGMISIGIDVGPGREVEPER